jgi:methylenetetrahydrofolate dehydrogenase (NADP+)/methenyltetrahydrofolate cyclohydrolase
MKMTGAAVTAAMNERIRAEAEALGTLGVKPRLTVLRVGEKAADLAYERGALKRMEACGIAVSRIVLPADVSQARLMAEIEALNHDAAVHGVLMFRPLPKQLDEPAVTAALSPAKDVDGITEGSMAGIYSGAAKDFRPARLRRSSACWSITA